MSSDGRLLWPLWSWDKCAQAVWSVVRIRETDTPQLDLSHHEWAGKKWAALREEGQQHRDNTEIKGGGFRGCSIKCGEMVEPVRPGTGDTFPSLRSECCSSPETVTTLRSPLWSCPSSRCPRSCSLILQCPDLDHIMIRIRTSAIWSLPSSHLQESYPRLGCCPASIVHVVHAFLIWLRW